MVSRDPRATRWRRPSTVGNSVEYGLSASIYTQDINKAFTAMREMYTGIFYVNAPTIGAETHLPFGGTKNTGNGHREACVQAPRRVLGVEVASTSTTAARCSARRSTPASRLDGIGHARREKIG